MHETEAKETRRYSDKKKASVAADEESRFPFNRRLIVTNNSLVE